MEFSQIISV